MDYKCCVCDLDGTLLDSSNKISADDRHALQMLSGLGVEIIIATGRSDLMIKEYLNDLGIKAPVISCNGGLIRDSCTGEILHMNLINPQIACRVIEYCSENRIQYLVYTPDTVYYSHNNERANRYLDYNQTAPQKFKIPLTEINAADRNIVLNNTIKILICGEKLSLIDELNRIFNRDNKLTIVSSSRDLIDIMASNTTKGGALVKLSHILNINLEKTVVFGDNYNDISMFEAAGLGIAVSNGEEELKKVAGYITRSNDESGVSYAIHNYVLSCKDAHIKGVIFDMDGVIIDSLPYHIEAWKQFGKLHNLGLSDEDVRRDFGRRNREILSGIFKRELSEEEIQAFDNEKEALYRELHSKHIKPAPGLMDFLKDLREKGIKTAIGSSAPPLNMKFVMDSLGLYPFIDGYAHAGMVEKGKPDPEIFLKSAELIGIPPENCVVFEDSLPGIEAGLRAGMKVIAVATTHREDELHMANAVIKSFVGLDKSGMEKMLGL